MSSVPYLATDEHFPLSDDQLAAWISLVEREPVAKTIDGKLDTLYRQTRSLRARVRSLESALVAVAQPPNHYEFTHSEAWYALRDACLAAAGHRCQVCNSADALQAHHRTYERFGGQELPTDLIALCRGCHDVFHRLGRLAGGGWSEIGWQRHLAGLETEST